jgi:deoxycytidylate deaminase
MKLTIEKGISIAIESAKNSTLKRYRLGCVIYDRNQYVTGYSHIHGVEVPSRKNKWSIHAEEMAIIKGSRSNIDFKNSIMIVVRINKNGDKLKMSKPCSICQNLINQVSIPKVYYSD